MHRDTQPPVLGFAGFSGSGKTTLLEKLIPSLRKESISIGLIKHAHHNFDIDTPGKDSYRLRKAGATETLITSANRWALIHEFEHEQQEAQLQQLLPRMDQNNLDLILYEGFKSSGYPLIWVQRESHSGPFSSSSIPNNVVALAWQGSLPENLPTDIKLLDLDRLDEIQHFVLSWFQQQTG